MAATISNIYQFKIILKETEPKIWRRIQVPENYSFCDLHRAIQNAMGWQDYHLHEFQMINPKTGKKVQIGVPDEEGFGLVSTIHEQTAKISNYFLTSKAKATYIYDFGDGWIHKIILEEILPAIAGTQYPQCIGGERACPPEDCGGVEGYEHLLEIIANPQHEEYAERMEWLEDGFDPVKFDPKLVKFFHF